MAFAIDLSYEQSNDATYITFTDASTDWANPDPDNTAITDAETTTIGYYHLFLDISITDINSISTTYDTIDLYTDCRVSGSGILLTTEMQWAVYGDDLKVSTVSAFSNGDVLPDGVWSITYTLTNADTETEVDSYSEDIIVSGNVRIKTYDSLRDISTQYDCDHEQNSSEIMESLLAYSFYKSLDSFTPSTDSTSIISTIYTLDKMLSGYSKYAW